MTPKTLTASQLKHALLTRIAALEALDGRAAPGVSSVAAVEARIETMFRHILDRLDAIEERASCAERRVDGLWSDKGWSLDE